MLELVEILDGLVLLLLYVVLTVFVPVALVGFLAGIVAIITRTILGLLPDAVSALFRVGGTPGRTTALISGLLLTGLQWMISIAAILYLLSFVGSGGGTGTLAGTLGGGARAAVEAFASLQDSSMGFWTGRTLAEVLAATGQTGDLHALGAFTALVAERLFVAVGPDLSLQTFRWVFALALGTVSLVSLGLTPVRKLHRLPVPALPAVSFPVRRPEERRSEGRALTGPATGATRVAQATPAVTYVPERAATPPRSRTDPTPGRQRIAIVSPRGDLSRDLMTMAAACGSFTPRHYSTLEEYESTSQAGAVILDARLLRWSAGSPTTNEHRGRTILAYAPTDTPPDQSEFAGALRSDAPADELRTLLGKLDAAA